MTTPRTFSDDRYSLWFAWVVAKLGSDRESAHVAAAIATLAEADGHSLDEAKQFATLATDAAGIATDRLRALAEWAYWATRDLGLPPEGALKCARQAVTALEAGADLTVALAVAKAAAAGYEPGRADEPSDELDSPGRTGSDSLQGRSTQSQGDSRRENYTGSEESENGHEVRATTMGLDDDQLEVELDGPSAGGGIRWTLNRTLWVIVGVVALCAATAGVVLFTSLRPSVAVTQGTAGEVTVRATRFPPNSEVYFFVADGRDPIGQATTDLSGSASILWRPFSLGNVTIEACSDPDAKNCPAQTDWYNAG